METTSGMEQSAPDAMLNGGVRFWTQTRLLFAKNWKCKLRTNKKKLAGEIFFPVLYLFLLSIIVKTQPRTEFRPQHEPNDTPTNILSGLTGFKSYGSNGPVIGVVPDSKETQKLSEFMNTIWQDAGFKTDLKFIFYSTIDELEDIYRNGKYECDLAVVFTDSIMTNYTVMTDQSTIWAPPDTSQKLAGLDTCRKNADYSANLEQPLSCPVNGYFYSGFLALQYLVDKALFKYHSVDPNGNVTIPEIKMQNYPKLEYSGGMPPFLRAIIPLYSVIPMAQLINSLLVLIVTEKEDRIKDGFRMIGVSDGAYWLSWFGVYSIIIGILSVMFTLVMHLTNVLRNINIVLLFLLFFLFGLSVITFAFALTPFFHKPKTAGIVGTLIMQFCGMLFMLQTFLKTSTDAFMVPLRLISSLAFTTALDEACAYEYNGGITFSDLLPNKRGARILYSLIFICFDIVFYSIIAVYLDNVIPNEYGSKRHPLFCFSWSFWRGKQSVGYERSSWNGMEDLNESIDDPNVEKVPPSMVGKEAIRICNVRKTYAPLFKTNKVEAIKGISLEIYDGQITAILGKNGAGKSTLFSIITGLIPPTSGKSIVFGLDTSDPWNLDSLRKVTGVCLQNDLHFASLTVEEHLELYGKLRGLEGEILVEEIKSLLEELKLSEKDKTPAANLSGGQKRKLSVAIALIGNPKIILLDEPSAGVDPVSRRHLWSLLKKRREGRVILLTTHFLDEADFLADRKAVIHDGHLKCCGSSLFLKNRFGVGYHLTIETEGRIVPEECDSIIRKWTPSALGSKIIIGHEIKYHLPHNEAHMFANLLHDLESLIALPSSPFKSYGVSMTTLEEVFLKICNDSWEEKRTDSGNRAAEDNVTNSFGEECNLIENLTELKVNKVDSLWVLCVLRIRRLIRSPQSLFFMIFMPTVLVAAGLALMKTQNLASQGKILTFDRPKLVYPEQNQLRLAVSGNAPAIQNLSNFLGGTGFETLNYSGKYSDLLSTNLVDPGTMAALSFTPQNIELRINGTFLHSPPLFLNMISQFYWQMALNKSSIITNRKMFPSKTPAFDATTFYAVFLIGPSFTFPAVGMVMELIKDREIHARNHLRVNGVSFGLYFLSIFTVFGGMSVLVTLMQIGLIYVFSLPAFMNIYAITVITTLLLLFIPSSLLFSTAFSYLFDRMESAQSVFSPISSWMGTIVGILIIVLDGLSGTSGARHVLLAHGFFSAFDVFYVPFGAFYWVNKQYVLCSQLNNCNQLSFSDYLGPEVIIMGLCLIAQVPIFAILVVVADVLKNEGSPRVALKLLFNMDNNFRRMHVSDGRQESADISNDNDDIQNETRRVMDLFNETNPNDNSVVIVKNLHKTYQPKVSFKDRCRKRVIKAQKAVKGVNFVVEEGEVFGLLGHNGAGKTTTLRIITGEECADEGRVRLCGTEIKSSNSDAFLKLGYCAQHDALWENITLREHLELYSAIRGVPKFKRLRLINHFITGLQIEEHSNKQASQLSGGTKRKLSYGISMLGAPKIVLLDEPSTGMDPQSKRFLWNTILGSFKDSRGAILTTHSMEEAEILSTRIAILAKGKLICIGSPQHLKSKYGTGYMLEIKLKPNPMNRNQTPEERYSFVNHHFPDCKINEIFQDKIVLSLPTASVQSISRTFSLLEELKQQHDFEEYSFSQTTLEQIFLQFAKESEENNSEEQLT